MVLHIFNPSHDEALAANYPYYYPSTISRKKTMQWGALPAIWAERGDMIWLMDAPPTDLSKEWQAKWGNKVRFVSKRELVPQLWDKIERIEPWGWDLLLRHQLRKAHAPEQLLPSDTAIASIRELSSRVTTSAVLPLLKERLESMEIVTIGESVIVRDMSVAEVLASKWGGAMAKSLWSCSGRGVFGIGKEMSERESRRLHHLLQKHGGVEMEPRYEPFLNFALEFYAEKEQGVVFSGISIFSSCKSGAYSGNVVAPQTEMRKILAEKGLAEKKLNITTTVCTDVMSTLFYDKYTGPFGIDMMLVRTDAGIALFPCVEVNLRRTMGHVALAIAEQEMRIDELPENLSSLWLPLEAL